MATVLSKISDFGMGILSVLPDMFVLCDDALHFLDIVNPRPELLAEVAGTPAGRSSATDTLQDAILRNAGSFRHTLLSGEPCRFDFATVYENREYRYEVNLSRVGTERVLACVHPVSDRVTDRIQSENLRYSFSEVLDHIAIPVSVKSPGMDGKPLPCTSSTLLT